MDFFKSYVYSYNLLSALDTFLWGGESFIEPAFPIVCITWRMLNALLIYLHHIMS
jgi:hypothetical protein